ncbi:MAG: hypothetical protein Tsb0020_18030 [Haliangiales bacterium]
MTGVYAAVAGPGEDSLQGRVAAELAAAGVCDVAIAEVQITDSLNMRDPKHTGNLPLKARSQQRVERRLRA